VDLGDSSDDEAGASPKRASEPNPDIPAQPSSNRRGWFDDAEPEIEDGQVGESISVPPEEPAPSAQADVATIGEEDEEAGRLVPLTSTAVPSIRDMLAADDALAKEEKRRARKEKRKRGG
jgi:IK cytokine